jgi:SAM-dependent methyltransferase
MPGISFDRAAEFYDATRGYPPGVDDRLREAIVAQVGLKTGARILEPAIGTGRIALPFLWAGFDYTGVDLSRQMMEALRGKLAGIVEPKLRLVQSDVMSLPFSAGVFDAAILVHILHLVDDWRAVLNEVWRVLRPGGTVIIAHDDYQQNEQRSPPQQVWKVWAAILDELGVPPEQRRANAVRNLDRRFADHLGSLGVPVEQVTLLTYTTQPITARISVDRYRGRVFSSCWSLPDKLHEEASRRLSAWLESYPEPDVPYTGTGIIRALVAAKPAG